MRWIRREHARPVSSRPPGWAGRLAEMGQALDASGLLIRDIALSSVDDRLWLCGFVWWTTRLKSGWTSVTLVLEGSQLIAPNGGPLPAGTYREQRGRSRWADRLGRLGQLLDQGGPVPEHPVILDVGEGFAVTARTRSSAHAPGGSISAEITAAQLAAGETGATSGRAS